MEEENGWRVLFEDEEGVVLISDDVFENSDEAILWGQDVLAEPAEHELLDPDGLPVPADRLDKTQGFSVEDEEGNPLNNDPDKFFAE